MGAGVGRVSLSLPRGGNTPATPHAPHPSTEGASLELTTAWKGLSKKIKLPTTTPLGESTHKPAGPREEARPQLVSGPGLASRRVALALLLSLGSGGRSEGEDVSRLPVLRGRPEERASRPWVNQGPSLSCGLT